MGKIMIAVVGAVAIVVLLFCYAAYGEDAWIICQPDSFVYIRERPSFHAKVVASPEAGDKVETTGRRSGDWISVSYFCEAGGGWVYAAYLTDTEPELYPDGIAAETDRGKVRARKYANGPVRKMLEKGTRVLVYAVSCDWAVTNLGYISTQCLLFDGG